MEQYHIAAAVLIARVFLGIVFLMQGYDKVFKIKPSGVMDAFELPAERKHIGKPFVAFAAYYTSYVELLGGLLLILGLFKYIALYALGLDLLMVALAFGVVQPVWDMKHVFPAWHCSWRYCFSQQSGTYTRWTIYSGIKKDLMKTILVATDFSTAAKNAAIYAAHLAKKAKAKLVLFNSFYVISPETSALTITYLIDTAQKEAMAELNKLGSELRAKLGTDVEISSVAKLANADFEIISYAEEMNVDLIVMGMKGRDKIKELLVGSTATNVISHGRLPVLLIPENATFRHLKNVVLATDYKKIDDATSLSLLREILELFGSNIRVASVITKDSDDEDEKGISPEDYLDDFSQRVHFIENKDIIEGLNEFVDKSEADLVVTIPRVHSFLYYLVSGSITRKMAFHTHVPLLSLPGSRHD